MDHVLAGIDGSERSLHAVKWATHLAGLAGLDLTVAWAADLEAGRGDEQRMRWEVEGWCSDLGARAAQIDKRVIGGHPPEALLRAARDIGADLLVVGTRGGGGFPHLHLGSVAHHLTEHTTLPLALVPPEAAYSVNRFVVGVDGSAGSGAAVELTAGLVERLRAPVTAVYSPDPDRLTVGDDDDDDDLQAYRHQAMRQMAAWMIPVEKTGVACEFYVDANRNVHPVAAIEYALEWEAGSVAVVGTRGLGGFSDARLGRVALQLVHHCHDPLILVPQ